MSRDSNSNGMPPWVKGVAFLVGTIGVPGFICLYLLGVFGSFLPNPIEAHDARLDRHDRASLAILGEICAGVWQKDTAMQARCRAMAGTHVGD